MLPTVHRLTRPEQFSRAVRSGSRAGRSTLVVHVVPSTTADPTKVGFVVSKAVGNSVTRNLVKRRLRAAARSIVTERPVGADVVVRALPASAGAGYAQLDSDLLSAWRSAAGKSDRAREARGPQEEER